MAVSQGDHRGGPLSWLTNRTLDSVDVDGLLAGVDLDALIQRVDVDELVDRVDIQAVVDRIDPQVLVDRIDAQGLVDRIDAQGLVERVDPDPLLDRVDPNRLLDRVEPDRLLDRVDPNLLLDRVDPDRLLDRVDPNRLLDRVDPNRLLDRVDPDRLLDRVDPNRLLDRVDPDRLLDRVDADRFMDQVDVDRIMARVDVNALVERAGVADIVADSTGAVAGSVLDTVRRQVVALDTIVERTTYRLTGRNPARRPTAPPLLATTAGQVADGRSQVTGTYAGPLSRLLAFIIDVLVAFWSFTLVAAGTTWVLQNVGLAVPEDQQWTILGFALFLSWCFLYWVVALVLTGRTIGKGVLGLKVLSADGSPLVGWRAVVRTLVEPVSVASAVGVLAALFTQRRTTLHDWVGRTCEVYDWGDRPAELPAPLTAWINNHAAPGDEVV